MAQQKNPNRKPPAPKPEVSGISEAALKGAGDAGAVSEADNAEAMTRPAPGLADPRRETSAGSIESAESTAGESAVARDDSPDDVGRESRRPGVESPADDDDDH